MIDIQIKILGIFKKIKWINISLIIFGLYLFIPERQENLAPIFFAASAFLVFLLNKKKEVLLKPLMITCAIYILLLISCFYSSKFSFGIKKMETMSSLIIFPIIFYIFLSNFKSKLQNALILFYKVFFVSNLLFCFYTWYISLNYRNPKFPIRNADFYRNVVSDLPFVGEHPIYVSMFVSLAILIGIQFYKKREIKKHLFFNGLILLSQTIMLMFLFLLMSKSVILALVLSVTVLFVLKLKWGKYFGVLTLVLLPLLIYNIPDKNNRFLELLKEESYNQPQQRNSTSIRMGVLKCNFLLAKRSPFIGYGIGNVQNELDKCYKKEINSNLLSGLNSHNQYFYILLSAGVLGIIMFIAMLTFYIKIAYDNKDYLFLSIIILFSVIFLFENILSRQTGVIMFGFIMNALTLKNYNRGNIKNVRV